MVVPSFNPNTFAGGQMTDLPEFGGPFDGTELIEVVAPGNADAGINYAVTTLLLATYFAGLNALPTIITSGATVGSPYAALPTDTRVLFNKTVGAASYCSLGAAVGRGTTPVMVRDLKGDADVNNITVSFTGTCDGLASPIIISAPYGGWTFNPLSNGNWYLTGI